MAAESRVQQLLDQICDSGSSPEEVCGDCPELLPEVRWRWRQMRAVEAELDALFPTSGPHPDAAIPAPWHAGGDLPRIPGYDVQASLGRGGMGIVYKARHLRLNRLVALKMLITGAYAGPQERARFQREAEAVASLRHANIVSVYDVGEHEGWPYFTMELVEGGSLAQALASTPLPARRAATILATLAEAMQVAHLGGIVHRDLKPANILLTADGGPKIADFGLARHFNEEAAFTLNGARIGTPSYMAPEQVIGRAGTIGPGTDIYALGALLYEMLTGRPPFRAETATETEQQVIFVEPVSPTRLNPKVPRDLETICLKCLCKDPQRRYALAAALADDLRRFNDGRPIQARPSSWAARAWRWVRRKPTEAALVATALVTVGLALGGGFWFERQRAEQKAEKARQEGRASQAVLGALEKAAALGHQGRWPEALAALDAAQGLLDGSAPPGLVDRLHRARADADMVSDLETIRLRMSDGRKSDPAATFEPEKWYEEAFRNYGIPVMTLDPAAAAARVRSSLISETLLAFMHDWLGWVFDENRARLRDVLDRADDDDWRYAFRKAFVENDADRLSSLAHSPAVSAQPPVVVSMLTGPMLGDKRKNEALAVMREAQQRHPGNFWINYQLGCFWWEDYPQEAVGYFRAAVAIRPTSDSAYIMLGKALRGAGDADGAIAAFREAVTLSSNYPVGRELAWALATSGGLEEARATWETFLQTDPPDADSWYGYAQLCLFLGKEEAYRRARKALLNRFGDTANDWVVAERTSLACLLLPDSGDELERAIRLADLAVAAGDRSSAPGNPYLRFVKGLALYRQGRPEQAVPLLKDAAERLPNRAGPRLALALAQFQSGSTIEARKTLAAAVRAYNWTAPPAAPRTDLATFWVSHVLRREAEAMMLPNLPAFLEGRYQPQENDERLALLGMCESRGLYGAAARLYADAFTADSGLADSMTAECIRRAREGHELPADRTEAFNAACRYRAARCAALVGCGRGKDGDKLGEAERARWRKQAREWLRADLTMWATSLDGESSFARNLAKRMLTNWQTESDLAGVRELHALANLSADERTDYLALWHEVRALLTRAGENPPTAALDPKYTNSEGNLPVLLMRLGRLNEARIAWKSVLEADPLEHDAWYGYAELCLFLGDEDEYHRARRALLEHFGTDTDPYIAERTSRACLLMPATGNELRQAVAVAERALARNSGDEFAHPYFVFARGLAAHRQGQFDQAISAMRGDAASVLGPSPKLVLAMALHRKGQTQAARKELASAVLSHDWTANQVRDQHGCIAHSLRREAEVIILPNLQAFLNGTYRPGDNDERLAMLGVCQFTNRRTASARIYFDAFATDRQLAENLAAGHRYNAARAAALAGRGLGADGAGLIETERMRWRRQARDWLRADLTLCVKMLDGQSGPNRALVRRILGQWQADPDLAGLREQGAIATLSADERKDCLALWQTVGDVLGRARESR
jgi:serine/threonine-protein kinase